MSGLHGAVKYVLTVMIIMIVTVTVVASGRHAAIPEMFLRKMSMEDLLSALIGVCGMIS